MKKLSKKSQPVTKSEKPALKVPCAQFRAGEMNIPTFMEAFYGEMLEGMNGELPFKLMYPVYYNAGIIALVLLCRLKMEKEATKALTTAFYICTMSGSQPVDKKLKRLLNELKDKIGLVFPDGDKWKFFTKEMSRSLAEVE